MSADQADQKTMLSKKEIALIALRALKNSGDTTEIRRVADNILLTLIGDDEITIAFKEIRKWYEMSDSERLLHFSYNPLDTSRVSNLYLLRLKDAVRAARVVVKEAATVGHDPNISGYLEALAATLATLDEMFSEDIHA